MPLLHAAYVFLSVACEAYVLLCYVLLCVACEHTYYSIVFLTPCSFFNELIDPRLNGRHTICGSHTIMWFPHHMLSPRLNHASPGFKSLNKTASGRRTAMRTLFKHSITWDTT